MDTLNSYSPEELNEICARHYVQRLSIFGSRLSGRAVENSDLDILVEFFPDHTPGFAFARLQDELSKIFGCRVDLRTRHDLSRYFRDEVICEAQQVYVTS